MRVLLGYRKTMIRNPCNYAVLASNIILRLHYKLLVSTKDDLLLILTTPH